MFHCLTGRGGGWLGGSEMPAFTWGGGRGGGCEGASGRVCPTGSSSLRRDPGPQATDGAFHCSPFRAAWRGRQVVRMGVEIRT